MITAARISDGIGARTSTTTNYDPIAEQYKRSKQQPWRVHVEAFTLMRLIGNPAGKVVIDVACGEGFYTRMIRQRGAAKVTGVASASHSLVTKRIRRTLHGGRTVRG